MRYLLRFSLALALVVLVLGLVGLFLPRSFRLVGSVAVKAPPAAVYPLVADLRRWQEWSPTAAQTAGVEKTFSPTSVGVGAWAEWTSRDRSGGRAEIVEARAPERLRYRLTYRGLPLAAEGTFDLVATGGAQGAQVTWTSEGRVGWSPLARWFGLLLRRAEGQEMERGLAGLRACAEKENLH